jgi:choline dehydrogenase-like flavoprotein
MATNLNAEVIVVGSGPGGATVARQLTRQGKRVLLLERGVDHRPRSYYGSYLGALIYSDRLSLLFTKEGINIVRPLMVGGATSMYCGCAAPPPDWLREKYGVDIDLEVSETMEELEIAPLPAELRGTASTRIAQAAQARGYDWQPHVDRSLVVVSDHQQPERAQIRSYLAALQQRPGCNDQAER